MQLIIVKLDRRYFIRRQERGDDGDRFHGSLTCAEMDRQRVALTANTPNYFACEGSNLLIYRQRPGHFTALGEKRRECVIQVPWFLHERKGRNPITVLIIGSIRDLPITMLSRLHRFGRRPGVNATVVLCNIPLRGRPTVLLLSRLSDSLRREISVVTSPRRLFHLRWSRYCGWQAVDSNLNVYSVHSFHRGLKRISDVCWWIFSSLSISKR